MPRWRLDVAYDGAGFAGWARQPGQRTVAGELERWTTTVLRLDAPATLVCAGRTDAGVHARGQVAHLDVPDDLGTAPDIVFGRLHLAFGLVLLLATAIYVLAPARPRA